MEDSKLVEGGSGAPIFSLNTMNHQAGVDTLTVPF